MISNAPAPVGNYEFGIGIDHGSTPNAQVAILAAVELTDPNSPKVYILDEYVSGAAPPEAHARAILKMIERNDLQPGQCRWTGDNIHFGSGGQTGKMSNSLLMRAFESIGRYPSNNLPWRIRTIRKPRYSVYYGAAMIHSIMARKQFFISPRCERLILSIQRWTMKKNQSARSRDEWGHAIDSMRYCLTPILDRKYVTPAHKIRMY